MPTEVRSGYLRIGLRMNEVMTFNCAICNYAAKTREEVGSTINQSYQTLFSQTMFLI